MKGLARACVRLREGVCTPPGLKAGLDSQRRARNTLLRNIQKTRNPKLSPTVYTMKGTYTAKHRIKKRQTMRARVRVHRGSSQASRTACNCWHGEARLCKACSSQDGPCSLEAGPYGPSDPEAGPSQTPEARRWGTCAAGRRGRRAALQGIVRLRGLHVGFRV